MDTLFLHLLNMSITAGWLVLALVLLRPLLRKAPKALTCALWAVVAIRLLCPFSIESVFSLLPSAEPIPQEILLSPAPQIDSGVSVIDGAINPILSESFTPVMGASVNPLQIVLAVSAQVWLLGVAAMVIYAAVSYTRVYRRVRVSVPVQDRVYVCDGIDTPFIFGILRPRIYLPSSLSEDDRANVLSHEYAHLKRFDHWWKPLGFVLLSVYWFHPLMWVAYILLCRDIETACDEHVLRNMSKADAARYAEALLHCSSKQRFVSACPLAFGESGVKSRIKYALSYKKPALWVMVLCVLASVTLTACFLTDPLTDTPEAQASDVTLSIKTLDLSAEPPTLTVTYQNNSGNEYLYGEIFRLHRVEGEELVDIDRLDNRAFFTIGYRLMPHQSIDKTYSLHDFDLSENGICLLSCFVQQLSFQNRQYIKKRHVFQHTGSGLFHMVACHVLPGEHSVQSAVFSGNRHSGNAALFLQQLPGTPHRYRCR